MIDSWSGWNSPAWSVTATGQAPTRIPTIPSVGTYRTSPSWISSRHWLAPYASSLLKKTWTPTACFASSEALCVVMPPRLGA
ncbi:hypothetical protein [Kutzneria chonburiensis]|uniref:hypothetical protein n=1 Tax=Kutzneria chonburiensis TaxID=1483604 RepID=UPI002361F7F4|nr:hypothetical protein [Kutzneria chonburiensis]